MRAPAIVSIVLVCLLGVSFNLWMAVNNADGSVDFNQFYAAGRLAGTGQLYNWDALRRLEEEHGRVTPTGRLPVVAYGMKLIGWMPYPVARDVWLAGSVAALVLFVFAWPGTKRLLMAAALAWSMPAALLLVLGQDTPFWLLWAAVGLLLMERGHPRWAGLVFALCICKFHLAVGLPVLLVAQRRWATLAAGAAAGAVLLAACFAIEGPMWPARYLANAPQLTPTAARMPNLHGIAWWLPGSTAVEIILCLSLVVLLWFVCRGTSELGLAGAAVAASGLLLGGHGYANDCAVLIPLLVLTIQRPGVPAWLKVWAVFLLTPATTLLLTTSKPFLGQLPILGFVIAALILMLREHAPRGVERPVPSGAVPGGSGRA